MGHLAFVKMLLVEVFDEVAVDEDVDVEAADAGEGVESVGYEAAVREF